jgi:16S rRNA (cytosine1402-N4)-methyltransferase
MELMHTPVMTEEVLEHLGPRSGRVYLDGTVGSGGHAAAILDRSAPAGKVVGLDADAESLRIAQQRLASYGDRVVLVHARYEEARRVLADLGYGRVEGVLLDLGISRVQLEAPERGFSFDREGPLDMRMDRTTGRTAGQLLASLSENEMVCLFKRFGEERWARRIARGIVRRRETHGNLSTTRELARTIVESVPRRSGGGTRIHPATRVFQALRIAVNRELDALEAFLQELPDLLEKGGRFCVISFHSLEDRLVKEAMQRWERGCRCPADRALSCSCHGEPLLRRVRRKALRPSPAEVERNPLSRSARLRIAERV